MLTLAVDVNGLVILLLFIFVVFALVFHFHFFAHDFGFVLVFFVFILTVLLSHVLFHLVLHFVLLILLILLVDPLVVVHLLVLLIHGHLPIVVHVDLVVLLLLEHQKLLLLLLVEHVDAAISSGGGNASWEIGQLIELVEVLGPLQQDLLVIVQVIVGVDVGVTKQIAVFLQITDLVVQIYEFLGLLLNEKGSLSNIKLHYSFLLIIHRFQIPHLISRSLQTMRSLFAQLPLIVANGWRLLHSVG